MALEKHAIQGHSGRGGACGARSLALAKNGKKIQEMAKKLRSADANAHNGVGKTCFPGHSGRSGARVPPSLAGAKNDKNIKEMAKK